MTTKLFECILNQRVVDLATKHDTLARFQFGYKKGHQTHDNIYSLMKRIRDYIYIYIY